MIRRFVILFSIFCLSFIEASNLKYLYFQGNKTFSQSELYKALGLKETSFIVFWKKREPKIDPKTIPVLKDTLLGFYEVKGFYHTEVKAIDEKDKIIFKIKEGRPVIVKKIDIKSDFKIKPFILLKEGERFDAESFIESKKNIKKRLLKKGYCSYDLDSKAKVDIVKNEAYLIFKLKKGDICYFGDVEFSGLKTVEPKVVKSYVKFRKGEPFSYDKIKETYDSLYSLGAFSTVSIKEVQKINNVLKYQISFRERKKKRRLKTGIGYETNIGPRFFIRWENRNFRGNAKKLSWYLKYSPKETIVSNGFVKPAVFSYRSVLFHFKNEIGYSYFDNDDYKEKRFFDKIHFFANFDPYNADFGLGFEDIKIRDVKNLCSIKEGNYFLVYPFLSFVTDKRDSKLNPRNGTFFSAYFEAGLKETGSATSYLKTMEEGRYIKTFENGITLALKLKLGLIKELEKTLPESKLFYGGGAYGNRAYGYKKLGATDAKCERMGGKTFVENSVEISHPVYRNFEGALFLDSTLISKDSLDFSTDFVHALGFGFRYISPIGPIKIDFGFNIKDPGYNAIHFLIGQSF